MTLLLAVASGCRPPAETTGPPAAAADAGASEPALRPCVEPELTFEAPAPRRGDETATLRVARAALEGDDEPAGVCVVVGTTRHMVLRGEQWEIAIAADPERLLRFEAGDRAMLVPVQPGGVLTLADHPCFGWLPSAPWLDPWQARGEAVACADAAGKCPDGFAAPGGPRPAGADPVCDSPDSRCVRMVRVKLSAAPGTILRLREADETGMLTPAAGWRATTPLMAGSCVPLELKTASDEVTLVAPIGADVLVEPTASGRVEARTAPDE